MTTPNFADKTIWTGNNQGILWGMNSHEPDSMVLACEDNLEFMARIPDERIKLIVTSPPYNLGKDYEAKTSLDDYLQYQGRVISECVRILHPQGSICWQVGNYVNNGENRPS